MGGTKGDAELFWKKVGDNYAYSCSQIESENRGKGLEGGVREEKNDERRRAKKRLHSKKEGGHVKAEGC